MTMLAASVAMLGVMAALLWAMPRLTRPEIYFAVTVSPDLRDSASGRAILAAYRARVLLFAALALALAIATTTLAPAIALPVGLLWLLGSSYAAFWSARKAVQPYAVRPSTIAEADLAPRDRRLPGGWLLQLGPFVLVLAAAVVLNARWHDLPERIAVHWSITGEPNGWMTRSPRSVYGQLALAAWTCISLLLVAFALLRGSRRIRASGAAAAAETAFRRTLLWQILAAEYLVSGIIAGVSVAATYGRAPAVWAIVLVTFAMAGTFLLVLLRLRQGGTGLTASDASMREGAPIGDRTPDRQWKAGLIYVNRDDPAIMVEKRFGMGYTLNFGNPLAWLLVAMLLGLLALARIVQAEPLAGETPRALSQQSQPTGADARFAGDWLGTLNVGAVNLRILFHIATAENGMSATMDSLDQNAKGIPVDKVIPEGSAITLVVKQVAGIFKGDIDGDGKTIRGTWAQRGGSLPLVLTRTENAAALAHRPQDPVRPYPYRDEEVTYANKAANVTLAATLTLPAGAGPFPAAILIGGSGRHDRDEALMGHRPFLVLANRLTRAGIATLRADKRGAGKSGGQFQTATIADFAADAEAALAYLSTRPEIDARRIGLIGHSEGGIVAPMIAARTPSVAFIVTLAGPGVPGDQILVAQTVAIGEASGMSRAAAEAQGEAERQLLAVLKEPGLDDAALQEKLKTKLAGVIPEPQIAGTVAMLTSPWMRSFLTYDPATALRQVRCPVLAVIGEKDVQVPPAQNLPAITAALKEAGNSRAEVVELPGLNHLLQAAKTGAPTEYAAIDETMSPIALEKITSWITALSAAPKPTMPAR